MHFCVQLYNYRVIAKNVFTVVDIQVAFKKIAISDVTNIDGAVWYINILIANSIGIDFIYI